MLRGENWETISDRLLDLEVRAGFFDIRVRGIPIWERVRFPTHRELLTESNIQSNSRNTSSDNSSKVKIYADRGVNTITNLIRTNPYISSKKDVVVLGHSRRKQMSDGYWWDIYCDPIYSETDFDYLHLEKPHFNGHFKPPKTENIKYLDSVINISHLARKIKSVFSGLTDEEIEAISHIDERIEEEFDVRTTATGKARFHLKQRSTLKRLYRAILRVTRPKLAFVLVSYTNDVFIEACKSLGIPVVELQHGVIYPRHFGYSFPGNRTKETFPDYFLSFGKFWKERVHFPLDDKKVIPVGYPFLEHEFQKYSAISSSDQILFISQGSIGRQLSKFAVELEEMVQSKVVYKLHPSEYDSWWEKYPHLKNSGITVIGREDSHLYRLFAESSVQVGVYSTAIYEGLMFGLSTYLVDLPGVTSMKPLIDNGFAEKINSVTECTDLIQSHSSGRGETGRKEGIRNMFEREPIANIESFVSEFIG